MYIFSFCDFFTFILDILFGFSSSFNSCQMSYNSLTFWTIFSLPFSPISPKFM